MRHVYLFGAGSNGAAAYRFWGSENIIAFLDNNPSRVGTLHNGKPVIDVKDYISGNKKEQIIITAYRGRFQVANQLEKLGIVNYYIAPQMFHNFWKNSQEIIEAYGLEKYKNIYIYGANPLSELVLDTLKKYDVSVQFVCDSNITSDEFCGCKVVELKEICNESVVVIMKQGISSEMRNMLSSKTKLVFDVFNRLDRYTKKEDIALFKGIHSGKRAFVIGNGPSLLADDLDKIYKNGEISFGCNSIYNFFDKTKWRPTYYVSVDCLVWEKEKKELINLVDPVSTSFIFYWNDEPLKMMKNAHMYSIKDSEEFTFTDDFSLYAYSMMGVSGYMLQLAIYMGISEIYLLGMDLGNLTSHFYGKDEGFVSDADYVNSIVTRWQKQYESLAKWCFDHNIHIYNATRGGALEAFSRVDFDSLFKH